MHYLNLTKLLRKNSLIVHWVINPHIISSLYSSDNEVTQPRNYHLVKPVSR